MLTLPKAKIHPIAFPISLCLIVFGCILLFIEIRHTDDIMRMLKLSDMDDFFILGKLFASTAGIILATMLIFALDPRRHEVFPRIIIGSYVAGAVNILFKIIFNRERPQYDRKKDYIAEVPLDEMGQFFVGIREGNHSLLIDSQYWSFPSGHSCVAGFFMLGYCTYYPQARWVFVTIAVLCMGSRIMGEDHFTSDTFVGLGVGMLLWIAFEKVTIFERGWRRVIGHKTEKEIQNT